MNESPRLHAGKALAVVILGAVVLGFVLGLALQALGVPMHWRGAIVGGVLGGTSVALTSWMRHAVQHGGAPWLRA